MDGVRAARSVRELSRVFPSAVPLGFAAKCLVGRVWLWFHVARVGISKIFIGVYLDYFD